ncbi:hypothetical protein LY78DRAFT_266402, partial [Colletotrichum sublineola]
IHSLIRFALNCTIPIAGSLALHVIKRTREVPTGPCVWLQLAVVYFQYLGLPRDIYTKIDILVVSAVLLQAQEK